MNILIAYDGSPHAATAMDDLCRAGLPLQASATVLSVADVWVPADEIETTASSTWNLPPVVELARTRAREALEEAKGTALRGAARLSELMPSWTVKAEATADSPPWAIVKLAEAWPADLAVLGSSESSRLDRLLLGGVSHKVLAEAPCSVRIGRQPRRSRAEPVRIVLGLDGSPDSRATVDAIAARDWPPQSEVRFVTAIDDKMQTAAAYPHEALIKWIREDDEDVEAWISRMIAAQSARLEEKGLRTSTSINPGDPKQALIEEATKWEADAIFVGARGHRMLNRLLVGSVSSVIAARASCSVEVVRSGLGERVT